MHSRVALAIFLLLVAALYGVLAWNAYGLISFGRGVPLSRILGYGLFSLAAIAASVLLLAGKARAASATVLLIFAANYGLYAYWAYVNNQKVFHEAPWSAVAVFVLVALSALALFYLVLKEKAGGLRSLEVFLGVFLIISVLAYGLAELDRMVRPGSVTTSVAWIVGLTYLGAGGVREAVWQLTGPLFIAEVALSLLTAALLIAGRGFHARPVVRMVDVAAGALWIVYGSALVQWYLSGVGYADIALFPPPYFRYFVASTAAVRGTLLMTTGALLIGKALGKGRGYAAGSPRRRGERPLTRGIV